MQVSKKVVEVIYHLNQDPLMTYQDLADRLGVTWITAKKRYEDLFASKTLRTPIANIDYEKLGFLRVNVIAIVPDYVSLLNMENVSVAHPHTVYRSRIIGREFGLFMVFYIPDESEALSHLTAFFERIKNENWVTSYRFLINSTGGISAPQDLEVYDFETNSWEFEWSSWFEEFQTFDFKTQDDDLEQIFTPKEQIDLQELDRDLLIILNRITHNASLRQADLVRDDELNISKTEAHRQYNFVMDNLISEVSNVFDRETLGLSDLKIFQISFKDEQELISFVKYCYSHPPAYGYRIQILRENGILFWSQMDQVAAQTLSFELFKHFSRTEIYDLVIHKSNSQRYAFYTENFDLEKKNWKFDYNWMVKQPLQYLKLE